MPAPKGHPRYGGRKKGVLNKRTQTLIEKCESKGIDVFEALLDIAQSSSKEENRLTALKELCQYLYPKRKMIEKPTKEETIEQAKELVEEYESQFQRV